MLVVNGNYKKIIFIVTIISIILFCTNNINAKKLFVGNKFQYKNIKPAIVAASNGDSIFVESGIYSEGPIVLNKSLSIIGKDFPILSGESKFEILKITSDNVLIEGLKFIDTGISFVEDNAAVKLEEVKNCQIKNNVFINNFFSVYLAKSSMCLIQNNQIKAFQSTETRSGNGIHLWYCKNISIIGNKIEGHRDGIYLEFVHSSKIVNNLSINNLRYGLHFMFSDSCSYSKNTFKQNGAGVAVMYTKNVIMTQNRFENNWGGASYGILLKEITDSKITNNYFYKNSSGIYIEASNRIDVWKNEFIENGWAIRLMSNSMDNNFHQNNFIGNSFDIATNSTKNFNVFNNNFWSEYKGYDIDKNGIGDIPYRPVKLFSLIVEKNRPTLILLRSLFVGILDAAEKIFPVLTPETLIDASPSMKRFL
jgi:nitrous oxidase accessory protein